ncbi:MAG: DNA replication and repair protein RecF [Candidatus Methanogasteraceae archaeon]|nr:MAG: DNA replication and repair protein RecF [ANME-2 cluster archaeon]
MIVSHITLKNWRNFQSVDVDLGNRVFLVGPNASGKSNFLDVFRFLRDIAKPGGGLQKAISDRGGIPKIRCLAARPFHAPAARFAILAANIPATNPASIFTTARTAHDWSIERRASPTTSPRCLMPRLHLVQGLTAYYNTLKYLRRPQHCQNKSPARGSCYDCSSVDKCEQM